MSNSVYKTVRYSCGIGKNTAFLDIKNYLDGTTTAVVARENTEGENFPLSVEDKLLIAGEFDAQEILDCIEEDVPEAIQKAMDNIFDGARCTGYRIVKL